MIFTVTSINKKFDMYTVVNEVNESSVVTSNQILNVLIQGYEFTNVTLTKKGFGIKTTKGTKYVQVPMTKDTYNMILQRLEYNRLAEEEKKSQMTAAIKSQQPKRQQITGKRTNNKKIVYKGEVFLSVESLCKRYNANCENFKQLYNMGYSLDECLGLVQPRPADMVTPRSKVNKMLDSMEIARGE
jgi:hypothetical protein